MSKENSTEGYVHLGHHAWTTIRKWLLDQETVGAEIPLALLSELAEKAVDYDLSEIDAQLAIQEGLVAARVQVDLTYDGPRTKKELEDMGKTTLSPLACVARWLGLIQLIQDGSLAGFIDKETGEDILPQLEEAFRSE